MEKVEEKLNNNGILVANANIIISI